MAKKSAKPKKKDGNKSQAIRDYVKQHADAGPTEIANALNAREGWKISAAYVSTIKNKMKTTRSARGRSAAGGQLDAKALLQAKELTKQVGGIDNARAALDLLAKISD
jgi:hypothetical protein